MTTASDDDATKATVSADITQTIQSHPPPQTSETSGTTAADANDVEMKDVPPADPLTSAAAAAAAPNADDALASAPDAAPSESLNNNNSGDDILAQRRALKELHQLIETTSQYLCQYKDDEGYLVAQHFQRLPRRPDLPDYFEVIKTPTAFSTVRAKILRKDYRKFHDFVHDVSLICHNAQVYNRPTAEAFKNAVQLQKILVAKLETMVADNLITPDDAKLPELGEIPAVEDLSSEPEAADDAVDEEEEEDSDDDDDEDDADDSDADNTTTRHATRGRVRGGGRGRGRGRARGRQATRARRGGRRTAQQQQQLTAVEKRIHHVLRGLRQLRNAVGQLSIAHFEKLPDNAHQATTTPIALDTIRAKLQRKAYDSLDHAMRDLELVWENAKASHQEGSPIIHDALELQKHARNLAQQVATLPENQLRDEYGKLILATADFRGDTWRVGDWVHLTNPNDRRKPIVAQIFRLWQEESGRVRLNACWYYRPDQSVHRFDRHFYDNEVFKTGQYRDHALEDIEDRCFVMYVVHYVKGRPRSLPPGGKLYVCESRYNEERFQFKKIQRWGGCVPDAVRDQDFAIDYYPAPLRLKKRPSPIRHLLQADAKETDDLPKPSWASPNGPPLIGAVHRRPREPHESPPPEATPPSVAPSPSVAAARPEMMSRVPSALSGAAPSPYHTGVAVPISLPGIPPCTNQHLVARPPGPGSMPMASRPATPASHGLPPSTPVPMPHVPSRYQVQPQPQPYQQAAAAHSPQSIAQPLASPAPTPGSVASGPPTPQHYDARRASVLTPQTHTLSRIGAPPGAVPSAGPAVASPYHPAPHAHTPAAGSPAAPAAGQFMPRRREVFTLDDGTDATLPPLVRASFKTDRDGRVLFFTGQPVNRVPTATLGHSVRYLSGLADFRAQRVQKRREAEARKAHDADTAASLKRRRTEQVGVERAAMLELGLKAFVEEMQKGNEFIFSALWGDVNGTATGGEG